MKSSNEKRDLEERIRDAIGTEEVTFDFDKWKASHQHQIEQFKSSISREAAEPAQVSIWLIIAKSRLTRFAAAAVVIVAIGILLYPKEPDIVVERPKTVRVEKTPAELMSVISLSMAFRDGDMEAMEKQFEKAEKKLRPGPRERITIDQLICELEECEEI